MRATNHELLLLYKAFSVKKLKITGNAKPFTLVQQSMSINTPSAKSQPTLTSNLTATTFTKCIYNSNVRTLY